MRRACAAARARQRRNRAPAEQPRRRRCGLPTDRTIPGTANIRQRQALVRGESARRCTQSVGDAQRLLVEYKPFEPAFYHTDIADWGMALLFARAAGPRATRARRHRPPLPVAEHRADRRVAARRGHARRVPLQRSPLRRRRPDARVDRSLPGVPHFPRDPRSSNGRPGGAPTSRT